MKILFVLIFLGLTPIYAQEADSMSVSIRSQEVVWGNMGRFKNYCESNGGSIQVRVRDQRKFITLKRVGGVLTLVGTYFFVRPKNATEFVAGASTMTAGLFALGKEQSPNHFLFELICNNPNQKPIHYPPYMGFSVAEANRWVAEIEKAWPEADTEFAKLSSN